MYGPKVLEKYKLNEQSMRDSEINETVQENLENLKKLETPDIPAVEEK